MKALNRSVVAGGVVYPAGTAATPELEAKITRSSVWDDTDGPAAPVAVAVEGVDYSSWSKGALEDEIRDRNGGRETPIVVEGKGNKPDLIAALMADNEPI